MNDPKVESSKLSVESKTPSLVLADALSSSDGKREEVRGVHHTLHTPRQMAWLRFRRNRAAVFSAWFLVCLLAAVIAWPLVLKMAGNAFCATAQSRSTFRRAIFSAQRATLVRHGFARARSFFPDIFRRANLAAHRRRRRARQFDHRRFVGRDCRLRRRTHRQQF